MLFICLLPLSALAQTSSVTATITDSDGQTWNNGTYTVTFVPTPGKPGPYNVNGASFPMGPFTGSLDSSGILSGLTLTDNSFITPSGSMWQFVICPNASSPCLNINESITGASPNLSSVLSAVAPVVRFPAEVVSAYGYADAEVTPIPHPGGKYWNVTTNCLRVWSGSTWACLSSSSGSGTVTYFSSGALSPLFTTSVTNPDTTPALSFNASTVAANTVFGNNTGSSAVPSFFSFHTPQTQNGITHYWLWSYDSTTGYFNIKQPSCADLSDAGAGCSGTVSSGITSINTDTTAAQTLTSADGTVAITNNGTGGHDFSSTKVNGGKFVAWNTSSTCHTTNNAYNVCTGTLTVPSVTFSNSSWIIVCSGGAQTGSPAIQFLVPSSTTQFTYGITNGSGNGAVVSYFSTMHCMAWGT